MKPILALAITVAVIALAAVGPFAVVLLIMIVPLIVLAMVSGWGLTHTGAAASGRRHRRSPVIHGRHVVNPDRTR